MAPSAAVVRARLMGISYLRSVKLSIMVKRVKYYLQRKRAAQAVPSNGQLEPVKDASKTAKKGSKKTEVTNQND